MRTTPSKQQAHYAVDAKSTKQHPKPKDGRPHPPAAFINDVPPEQAENSTDPDAGLAKKQ
jgi:hypothetical protein